MTDTTNLQKLVAALDLTDLPASEQDEIMLDVNEAVFKSALVRIIEGMDEPTRAEFATLMESEASEEAIETFFAEKVPGATAAVEEAVESLTNDILVASEVVD